MITFKQYLTEARMAPLYHGTRLKYFEGMVRDGEIKTGYPQPLLNRRTISLTRNFTFAKMWAQDQLSSDDGIVIEFDQQKLAARYKIVPFNFAGASTMDNRPARVFPDQQVNSSGLDYSFDNQFEEAVLQNIKNPLRYITKIYIKDKKVPASLAKLGIPVYSIDTRKEIK